MAINSFDLAANRKLRAPPLSNRTLTELPMDFLEIFVRFQQINHQEKGICP